MIRRPTISEVLNTLVKDGIISDSMRSELEQVSLGANPDHAPWFVRVLIGVGAWVAAGLLCLFLSLAGIVRSTESAFIVGLILIVITTVLRYASSKYFWKQLAMAGCIAGQLLSITGAERLLGGFYGAAIFALCVELVVLVVYPDTVMCFLTAAGAAGSLFMIAYQLHRPFAVDLVTIVVMFGGGLLWLMPPRRDLVFSRGFRIPVAYGLLLFGLGLLVANVIAAQDAYYQRWMLLWPTTLGLSVFAGLFSLSVFRTYGVRLISEPTLIILVAIGLLSAATLESPGVIASLAVFGLAFQRRSIVLLGLACVFLIGFVFFFYYSLNSTLLVKSGMLFGSGTLLFALWLYLRARLRIAGAPTP